MWHSCWPSNFHRVPTRQKHSEHSDHTSPALFYSTDNVFYFPMLKEIIQLDIRHWYAIKTVVWVGPVSFINNSLFTHYTVAALLCTSYRVAPAVYNFVGLRIQRVLHTRVIWFHWLNWLSWVWWGRIQVQWAVFVHCLVLLLISFSHRPGKDRLLLQKIQPFLATDFVVVSCFCRLICQRELFLLFQEGSFPKELTTKVGGWPSGWSRCGFWRALFTWRQWEVEIRSNSQREGELATFVFQSWAELEALFGQRYVVFITHGDSSVHHCVWQLLTRQGACVSAAAFSQLSLLTPLLSQTNSSDILQFVNTSRSSRGV